MAFLLDTHALLFWSNQQVLSKIQLEKLDRLAQQGRLHISTVVFWEIALLIRSGRLADFNVQNWSEELQHAAGIRCLSPTIPEMLHSVALPPHHKDPFDRLMIAQALLHQMTLITKDQTIQRYEVPMCWEGLEDLSLD